MRSQPALFLRALLARAYPRVIGLLREPSWLIQEAALPLFSVAAFVFLYRAMGAGKEFEGFVILGGAMTAFWLNVLWAMGAQLYWERDAGNLELFIIAPSSLMAVLAGMAVGGMLATLVRAIVVLVIGSLLFGVTFGHEQTDWLAVAVVFLLTLAALYGLGMVFASVFLLWGREAWHIVNLLQEPVYLLSGLNFPVRSLGFWVALAGSVIPMTAGIDALRQLLFRDALALLSVGWEIAILAVLAVAFVVLARRLLIYMERRAREEGRLTVKWQ